MCGQRSCKKSLDKIVLKDVLNVSIVGPNPSMKDPFLRGGRSSGRLNHYPTPERYPFPDSYPGPFELPRFPRGETKPGLPGIFDTIPFPRRRRKQTYEECQRAVSASGVMHIMDPCRDLPFGGSNPFPDMDPRLPDRLPGGDRDIDPGIFPPTLPERRPDKEQFPSLPTGPSVGQAVAGTAGYFLGKFLKDRFKL